MDGLYTLAGFAIGALVGLTGVGGGALMTPILVLLFGVAPIAAVGTDLWFAAITKTTGGLLHNAKGSVDWQIVRRLLLGSLPAALVTLTWLYRTGASEVRQGILMQALGGVLVLTAVAMALRKQSHDVGRALRTTVPLAFLRWQPIMTVLAGAVLGVLVSLTSVGAGALGAVMLLYLYPLRMQPARLVGTDIVHAIPLTLVAGIGHLWMGHVQWTMLGWLLLGSLPGVLVGACLTARMRPAVLRPVIAVMLLVAGVKLLMN